jgi:thiol-disulfide isomerase/thioredoxin
MKIKNGWILLVIIAAVMGTIWLNLSKNNEKQVASSKEKEINVGVANCKGVIRPEQGACAPNFALETMDGKKVELYKNNGKPSLINFWASWCGPCKKEMPDLQQAYNQYKDHVNFLMVNETAIEDDEEMVFDFVKKNRYTFPILLDRLGTEQKTVGLDQYGVQGVPMTYVVAPDGKIVYKKIGMMTKQELDRVMQSIRG